MCNVQSQCNLCIFDEQNGELFTIIQQTSSFVFLPQVPSPKSRVPSPNMSNVIDLTEEPVRAMNVPNEIIDLTGTHVVIRGAMMILDDDLTIERRVELRVEQELKAAHHRRLTTLRATIKRNKTATKLKEAEYYGGRQADRDNHRMAYVETYHNCIESDIALAALKKNMAVIASRIKSIRMREKKVAATNAFAQITNKEECAQMDDLILKHIFSYI